MKEIRAVGAAALAALLLCSCGAEPTPVVARTGSPAVSVDVAKQALSQQPAPGPPAKRAVLAAEDLNAALAKNGSGPLPVVAVSEPAMPLAPGLERALFSGPGGLPLDALDDLVIAFEEEADDELSLVLGGTSVVEDTLEDPGVLDPFSEADSETLQ